MDTAKIRALAEAAELLPWERPGDVPHERVWAFREGVRPEDILKLLAVVDAAKEAMRTADEICAASAWMYGPEPMPDNWNRLVEASKAADEKFRSALAALSAGGQG